MQNQSAGADYHHAPAGERDNACARGFAFPSTRDPSPGIQCRGCVRNSRMPGAWRIPIGSSLPLKGEIGDSSKPLMLSVAARILIWLHNIIASRIGVEQKRQLWRLPIAFLCLSPTSCAISGSISFLAIEVARQEVTEHERSSLSLESLHFPPRSYLPFLPSDSGRDINPAHFPSH